MQRLIDAKEAIKNLTGWQTDPTDEEIEYTITGIETVLTIPDNPTNGDIIKAMFPNGKEINTVDGCEGFGGGCALACKHTTRTERMLEILQGENT